MILYKEGALSPISVVRSNPLTTAAAGVLGLPLVYNMLGKPFLGNTPVDTAINATYGKIPFLGKHLYGAQDAITEGIEKIKDPSVRSQLLREGGGVFSPKKLMHGADAVKHHLMSNISVNERDRNNPLFKNIRELSTNPDSSRAYQQAVEEGRTANINFDKGRQTQMMSGLSGKQQKSVKKQQDEFLDAMVGAGRYGWR